MALMYSSRRKCTSFQLMHLGTNKLGEMLVCQQAMFVKQDFVSPQCYNSVKVSVIPKRIKARRNRVYVDLLLVLLARWDSCGRLVKVRASSSIGDMWRETRLTWYVVSNSIGRSRE